MSADIMLYWAGHTGLDISILIMLVLLCRRPFVKMFGARAAYALWTLPLLRLVLPEIPITLPRPSWMQAVSNVPTEVMTYSSIEPVIASPVSTSFNWQYPVVAIWLSIAIIWFVAQLLRQQKYIKTVQADAVPVSDKVCYKLNQARKSLDLSAAPKICMSSSNVGPFVTGIFKPVIVLPQNFEKNYSDHQQFFALAHELAHIKRGDLWAAFVALLFRSLNWPNPLVHYCAVKFRTDQEAACDAYVLNNIGGGPQIKESYAETLIHSATLAAKVAAKEATKTTFPSTTNSTRTSTNYSVLANPLCLTIYHPLKERLMTLKTTKNTSTILSRIGVGAFLVAALAATAPITIASAADGPAAETPKVKKETKKVMKWVDNKDGEETTKHIEVIVEDGVTTAYSIDKDGNKTEIDASEVEMMDEIEGMDGMRVFVTDGMSHEKHIKIMKDEHMKGMKGDRMMIMEDFIKMDGKHMRHMKDGEHSNIIIKRISKGEDGTVIDIDNDFRVFSGDGTADNMVGGFRFFAGEGEGNHAAAMVGAAQGLLDQAEIMTGGKELSSKTRKKLNKARKALKEAQEALEAEE